MQPQDNNPPTPEQPTEAVSPNTAPPTAQPADPTTTPAPVPPIQPQPAATTAKNTRKLLFIVFGAIFGVILLLFILVSMVVVPHLQEASRRQAVGTQHYVSPDSELGKGIAELDKTQLTAQAKSNAEQLSTRADAYKAKDGAYPATITDFQRYPESKIPSTADKYISQTKPTSGDAVYWHRCSATGAQITYFDTVQNKQIIVGLGTDKNKTTSCA
jgi:hypothetical protein